MQKSQEVLTPEQIDAARDFLDAERGRCIAEVKRHLHLIAGAMARNKPLVKDAVDAVTELKARIAVLDGVAPVFDELGAQLERERVAALAEDRLATLVAIEIPAAIKAFEAAKAEPKPPSHGGDGLIAVQKYYENIRGREANLKALQAEHDELAGRIKLLGRDATSENAA